MLVGVHDDKLVDVVGQVLIVVVLVEVSVQVTVE